MYRYLTILVFRKPTTFHWRKKLNIKERHHFSREINQPYSSILLQIRFDPEKKIVPVLFIKQPNKFISEQMKNIPVPVLDTTVIQIRITAKNCCFNTYAF